MNLMELVIHVEFHRFERKTIFFSLISILMPTGLGEEVEVVRVKVLVLEFVMVKSKKHC